MKKVSLAILAIVFNMFLFSCNNDAVSENDTLYETQSTEGDDGQVKPPPPPAE